jgi:hypothetical protein
MVGAAPGVGIAVIGSMKVALRESHVGHTRRPGTIVS